MLVCLLPQKVAEFKKALKERQIDIKELLNMTSEERIKLFEKYAGSNAKDVNLLFEQKLVLKNKMLGLQNWASKVGEIGRYDPAKKAQIDQALKEFREQQQERIFNPSEEQAFLSSLAEKKLGVEVTKEEAQKVFEFTEKIDALKNEYNEVTNSWTNEKTRLDYGSSKVALDKYVESLKGKEAEFSFANPLKQKGTLAKFEAVKTDIETIFEFVASNSRALVASIDNSFWGNQGISVLFNPKFSRIWGNNFIKSFNDIYQVLKKGNAKGDEILDAVRADAYSRPNNMNGRYNMSTKETSKLDIRVVEEEIPTSLPEKIPVLGRLFKASEVAYEAGAMRMRMDIADKIYSMFEKNGIDLTDKFQTGSVNSLVNSMTGRGSIGAFQQAGKQINMAVFAIRFVKSSLDILTAHMFSKISPAAKMQAAKNLVSIVATMGTVLGIAKALDNNSTDLDPRSTNFGKINGISITGPFPAYIRLFARILTQSTKNSETGIVTKFGEGYGSPTGMSIFWQFTENKASPLFSVIRDLVRQETFEGEKPNIVNMLSGMTQPITVSNIIDSRNQENALLYLMGSGLSLFGFDVNTFTQETKWENGMTQELQQFKEKVGDDNFKKANDAFNKEFNDWFKSIKNKEEYTNLEDEDKKRLLTNKKAQIKRTIFQSYNFKPQKVEKEELPQL